jgi:hypothetical protein
MPALDEHFFDNVLDLFDRRNRIGMELRCNRLFNLLGERQGNTEILAADRLRCLENRVCDLVIVIRNEFTVAFSDG